MAILHEFEIPSVESSLGLLRACHDLTSSSLCCLLPHFQVHHLMDEHMVNELLVGIVPNYVLFRSMCQGIFHLGIFPI